MAIVIKNVNKNFQDVQALKNLSLSFQKNKITGLIGFNGSGKTTTFNILANFLEKYQGEVLIDGEKITKDKLKTFSYLAAGSEPKNATLVKTHLIAIAKLYGLSKKHAWSKIEQLSSEIGLTPFITKPIKSLSKGNQQKLKVVSSLLNPRLEYLLLDEPFDGLDPIMVRKIQNIFMRLKNVTIIITSHRMDVVEDMCEEFFVLKEGVLVDSKKISDKEIQVLVNKQVPITSIKKLKYVTSVTTNDIDHLIIIDDIKHFKDLNQLLIKNSKYIYSSIKEKSIAESVFERYENE